MTSASVKSLRTALLSRLADLLAPGGYHRRGQSFDKEECPVRLSFHVAFISHAEDFDVTADVGVRHHAVEELLDGGGPPRPRDQQTATVGAELGNIAGVGQHRWTVRDESDVQSVAESVVVYYRHHGEPFLVRFSDAGEVLRVLIADGPEARLICPIPDRRRRVLEALRGRTG